MENHVEKLKHSPMFNLSLSSKELFHSNFLYWLNAANPEAFYSLLKDCFGYEKREDDIVMREYNNYDLCIVSQNKQKDSEVTFVLENKVKSMPKLYQLQRYVSKNNKENIMDCHYVLLTLITDFPDRNAIIENKWKIVSYKDLAIALQRIVNQFEDYHKAIINDYISYIIALDALSRCWLPSIDDSYDKLLKVPKYISGLRLESLYLNQVYSWLSMQLNIKLQEKNIKVEFGKGKDDIFNEKAATIADVYLNNGITRAQGLLDIKIKVDTDCILGVQIQGEQFRHVVEWIDGTIDKNWNRSKGLKFLNVSNYAKRAGRWESASKEEKKEDWYCKFGNCFIYKYLKIGTPTTISDVIAAILEDIDIIKNGDYR